MATKRGRKTKCTPALTKKLLNFFNREPVKMTKEKFYYKNGDEKEKEIEVANELPYFSEFEREEGLAVGRCSRWAEAKDENGSYKYSEFRQAYKMAKKMQEEMLVKNALKGLYSGAFSIFTAKNIVGWRDKTETDVTSGGEKVGVIMYPQKNDQTENTLETISETGNSTTS